MAGASGTRNRGVPNPLGAILGIERASTAVSHGLVSAAGRKDSFVAELARRRLAEPRRQGSRKDSKHGASTDYCESGVLGPRSRKILCAGPRRSRGVTLSETDTKGGKRQLRSHPLHNEKAARSEPELPCRGGAEEETSKGEPQEETADQTPPTEHRRADQLCPELASAPRRRSSSNFRNAPPDARTSVRANGGTLPGGTPRCRA
ncbi:hypothetical protein Bra471DRAFT_03797 [Bradyrhizobium sp. WSM471]|nr:hypothetical protein Bra471DRAFT_03797 [Bradyrhizobium sp. WSM471]